ncbi:TPA: hypothetical protein UOA81_001912 [Stenotrophomonas maltophilia]|nr:hypothetical protein [Stenotrophomonas maltophilia]
MALVACDECGREISTKAVVCVGCGAPITASPLPDFKAATHLDGSAPAEVPRRSEFRAFLWISLVLLSALVGTLLWKMASRAPAEQTAAQAQAQKEEAEQRSLLEAVGQCDKRYAQMNSDRQYTPADLRVYAQLCKQLREDFKSKWGREP